MACPDGAPQLHPNTILSNGRHPPKLLDQAREHVRRLGYSIRTEPAIGLTQEAQHLTASHSHLHHPLHPHPNPA
jgi:hypothetical protein